MPRSGAPAGEAGNHALDRPMNAPKVSMLTKHWTETGVGPTLRAMRSTPRSVAFPTVLAALAACGAIVLCLSPVGCDKLAEKFKWSGWRGSADANSSSAEPQPTPQTQPAPKDAKPTLTPEEVKLRSREISNLLLREEMIELRAREKRLTNKVNQLKFLNSQLQEQVKALADAPGERDRREKQVRLLKAEIEQLKKRIEKLAPAPGPSTLPTKNASE